MTSLHKRTLKPGVLAIASALTAMSVQAQNLVELYDAARGFDSSYQSARLQYDANLAKADQAKAGILPTAGLNIGVSRTGFDNTNPAVDRNFSTENARLTESQHL